MKSKSLWIAVPALTFMGLSAPAIAAVGSITNFAGSVASVSGFAGDGGQATAALLGNNPWSTNTDALGNVYIADTANSRIRKVDASGVITTVAGSSASGFGGDGGSATLAKLSGPQGVAIDAAGNLYIADTGNNRIRKVNAQGIISTIAGGATWGYSGDTGAAVNAILYAPSCVAVDTAGKIDICDYGNSRVRQIDTSGLIYTIAGNGHGGYNGDGIPAITARVSARALAIDSAGNLYLADEGNNRIRRVDAAGLISTFAGTGVAGFGGDGGSAAAAKLWAPMAVTADAQGNVFIADTSNNRVRMVDNSGVISTVAGTGLSGSSGDGSAATSAQLSSLYGISVDAASNIYIPDGSHRIRKISGAVTPPPSTPSGDVPLPLWSLALLATGLMAMVLTHG